MDLQVTLGLLLAVSAVTAAPDILNYTPEIANITGNVTDRAFVLVQPNCIFTPFTTDNVWLVVALNTTFLSLNDTELGTPSSYTSFMNGETSYYRTLLLATGQYPCLLNSTNSMYLLQIGSETNCTGNLFCNGPLNANHTYRTKFILLDSTGLSAETKWSTEIVLKTATDKENIVLPFSRSGGMIVITVLLSVLLAILLICLIVALIIGSKNICWRRIMDKNDFRSDDLDYMTSGTYTSQYKKIFKTPIYEEV
ncbi:uroplakin-3b-like [Pseudophryne corroboree]|uniref:uroplakin-3b-like n=1 Tax=Pseudophryne corroboree TaxID=495146 RepID=UPI003081EB6A